ncbi:helix-turn-helix domain-containing protein [Ruminococcus sp. OA3]|uniref:helix-turn-helix domain-containing protein n=1 Tax=Ruminococcus sp. OA3 TaxID=2914164 RepID=UPI001F05AC6F|nr:helix-turn-helix transcriptional regulator [Ruminococcus sp. OA3]MCH1983192.1 helix-turn-helix domain-containing protein [Ruminococcus sp. OA3]
MKEINIGKILIEKRQEKGITQEELAVYAGVSKAAVSKWETGVSYPDISLLPQLAAYFNISIDTLMGYEPQMTKEDIRKLYHRLAADFAHRPFQEVMAECEAIIRKYYSCESLLLQMAVLLLNHAQMAPDACEVLDMTIKLCKRTRELCVDVWSAKEASQVEASVYLMRREPQKVMELFGETLQPMTQESELLAIACQAAGNTAESRRFMQVCIYQHLLFLVGDSIQLLTNNLLDAKKTEETIQRILQVCSIYEVDTLHMNTALNLYMVCAQYYCRVENKDEAVRMLERYVHVCSAMDFPLRLCGDSYFDQIESWLKELELGLESPVNTDVIKESLMRGLTETPELKILKNDARFKRLVLQLTQILEVK